MRLLFILSLIAIVANMANAQALTLKMENDVFAGDDSDYTHGTRIEWDFHDSTAPDWFNSLFGKIPVFWSEKGRFWYTLTLGQDMFTPDNIGASEPIYDDRPYAGYLYLGLAGRKIVRERTTFFEVDIGVVGPYSMAEDVQSWVHERIGSAKPNGWDNQLHNEPTIQLQYWESKG